MKVKPGLFHGGLAAVAVLADQVVKRLVEARLDMHVPVEVLPFLSLYRTHNTGVAFSLMSSIGSLGLAALTLAITGFVLWIALRTDPRQVMARIGFALIVGGAIGNLIDRLWLGHVVDYVLLHAGGWSFAIFNLADAFITVGAAMVILDEALAWLRGRKTGDGRSG